MDIYFLPLLDTVGQTTVNVPQMAWATAWFSVLSASINPAGSTCIQEHGQVHHPPGYCAAI